MSGPEGGDDDLDEVTLWAGRLRAWPAAPPSDAEGDDTVRSERRSAREPARAVDAESDETVRWPRPPSAGGEPASGGPVDSEVLPDDDTAPRRAARSRADVLDHEADDQTVRSRPAADFTGPRPVVGVPAPEVPAAGDPVATAPAADDLDGADTAAEATGADAPDADDTVDDDDTASAVHRRSPRAADPLVDATTPGAGREAHAPTALHRETYGPRVDAPVRVARSAVPSVPRVPDAAAVAPRHARGGARLLVLAAVIVGVVALAIVGVVLLLG